MLQWRRNGNHALFMWLEEGGVWIDSQYGQGYRLGSQATEGFPSHPLLTQPDSRLYSLTSTTGSLLPKLGRNGFTKGENSCLLWHFAFALLRLGLAEFVIRLCPNFWPFCALGSQDRDQDPFSSSAQASIEPSSITPPVLIDFNPAGSNPRTSI